MDTGFENRTTVAVEQEVNDSLGRKKDEFDEDRRNETVERLIKTHDQLPDYFHDHWDVKAFFSCNSHERAAIFVMFGEAEIERRGFRHIYDRFQNVRELDEFPQEVVETFEGIDTMENRPAFAPEVKKRDGHACRVCGIEEGRNLNLHVHYTSGNPDKSENWVALCGGCHVLAHRYSGSFPET